MEALAFCVKVCGLGNRAEFGGDGRSGGQMDGREGANIPLVRGRDDVEEGVVVEEEEEELEEEEVMVAFIGKDGEMRPGGNAVWG